MHTSASARAEDARPRLVLVPSARPRIASIVADDRELLACTELAAHLQRHVDALLVHTGLGDDAHLHECEVRVGALLEREDPDVVLVRGESNAALATARAAAERFVPLVRLDAGVRSGRADTPAEHNRVLADHLSDLLFAPTERARDTLRAEGVRAPVHVAGDMTNDLLARCGSRPAPGAPREAYALAVLAGGDAASLAALGAAPWPVLLVGDGRTRARLAGLDGALPANVRWLDAPSHEQQLALERDARAILTDRGDVQREAYLWGVPCVTLAEETQWVETVGAGWNTLAGTDGDRVAAALSRPRPLRRPALFGDPGAAERTAELICAFVARSVASTGRRWAG